MTDPIINHLLAKCIIGSILIDTELIKPCEECLCPEDFPDEDSRNIYMEMIELKNNGLRIDPITIICKLNNPAKFGYLKECITLVPTTSNLITYIRMMKGEY